MSTSSEESEDSIEGSESSPWFRKQHSSHPIDFEDPPYEEHIVFKEHAQCEAKSDSVKRGVGIPPTAPVQTQTRDGYASFGDGGTTATVNAYGEIMQLSRFSEATRSGFFCVDLSKVSEPYFVVERMQDLTDLSKRHGGGIGLHFDNAKEWHFDTKKPSLEFIHDVWPRYTFEIGIFPNLRYSASVMAETERSFSDMLSKAKTEAILYQSLPF